MKDYADVILCPEATELSKVRLTWNPPPKMSLVNLQVPAHKALPSIPDRVLQSCFRPRSRAFLPSTSITERCQQQAPSSLAW